MNEPAHMQIVCFAGLWGFKATVYLYVHVNMCLYACE